MRILVTIALLALASCEASSDSKPVEMFGSDAPMPTRTVWVVTPSGVETNVFESEDKAKAFAAERGWNVIGISPK